MKYEQYIGFMFKGSDTALSGSASMCCMCYLTSFSSRSTTLL